MFSQFSLGKYLAALLLCLLLAGWAPVAEAPAQTGPDIIQLDPSHGPPGARVRVSGQWGNASYTPVDVFWDFALRPSNLLYVGDSADDGTFDISFTVPENAAPGTHTVIVFLCCPADYYLTFTVDEPSGVGAEAYTMSANPAIAQLPSTGPSGLVLVLLLSAAVLPAAFSLFRFCSRKRDAPYKNWDN